MNGHFEKQMAWHLKGLDQKQWQITNITKLRVAGMEDADVK